MATNEYFTKFSLSKAQISELSVESRALIALSSHALNEVNVFLRMHLMSQHQETGQEPIDELINIQKNVILRNWSAKLFEFKKTLTEVAEATRAIKDPEVKDIVSGALVKFDEIFNTRGFGLAELLRKKATNHYDFFDTRGLVSDDVDMSIFLHDMQGNCVYPYGESVFFYRRLHREVEKIKEEDAASKLSESWIDWNIATTNWLSETHSLFLERLIFDKFPQIKQDESSVYLDPQLVAFTDQPTLPVISRRRPQ